jgi:hypothetical protein
MRMERSHISEEEFVSTKNHPQIAKRISPVPIKVCVNVNE